MVKKPAIYRIARADARFADLIVKASESDAMPFARLKVKVKPEIISFRRGGIVPEAAL